MQIVSLFVISIREFCFCFQKAAFETHRTLCRVLSMPSDSGATGDVRGWGWLYYGSRCGLIKIRTTLPYIELVPFPDFFTGEERAIENTGVALRPNRFRHRTS